MPALQDELKTVLDSLTAFHPKDMDLDLTRTLRLLKDLGDPHLNLPPVIHVAGTNGKGSTIAFLRAIAEAAGLKVHVMTSPHLVRFNERLVIAGTEISDDDLLSLLQEVKAVNAGQMATFFEITSCAGFLAFARSKADLCLLETGLGGRLDATNVVPNPAATILTSISYDHMHLLGDTLKKIAAEKACIMKSAAPCIVAPQTQQAWLEGVIDVISTHAHTMGTPLLLHGRDWDYQETEHGFDLQFKDRLYSLPQPNLLGKHQIANAATAIAACLAANLKLEEKDFVAGLQDANWPARLQQITSGPLYELLPKGSELWLDGGHNEDGGRILADQAKTWQAQDGKPLHLILGMLTTKNPEDFYRHLRPHAASAQTVSIPDEKLAYTSQALASELKINAADTMLAAIKNIVKQNKSPQRILIAGSLYLAGQILSK